MKKEVYLKSDIDNMGDGIIEKLNKMIEGKIIVRDFHSVSIMEDVLEGVNTVLNGIVRLRTFYIEEVNDG